MTSLDQMLSYAGSKIAQMSKEFEKHRDSLIVEDFKTMTKELKKTKKNLSSVLGSQDIPQFDQSLLSSLLSYISKIKKSAPKEPNPGTRRSQRMIFLDELVELQGVLKILQTRSKEGPASSDQIKTKSIIKIQGIKSKGAKVPDPDLNKHLSLTEVKLDALKKSVSKNGARIKPTQYRELNTILKKANLSLVKAKAMHKSLSGQYKPDYDKKVMKKIMQEILFIQDVLDDEVRSGTAQMQANLFWFALREFQTLIQDLESLKKTRGKAVANVQTDLAS